MKNKIKSFLSKAAVQVAESVALGAIDQLVRSSVNEFMKKRFNKNKEQQDNK